MKILNNHVEDVDYVKSLLKLRFKDRLSRLGLMIRSRSENGDYVCDCFSCGNKGKLHISETKEMFYCFNCQSSGTIQSLFNQS
jgi:hypothetical protein